MRIRIHRGQNQIGGSIIEISTDHTRIILDAGSNLDEGPEVEVPKIEGLFCGTPAYDAILISHYHSDHIGLLPHVLDEIPIYMGRQAFDIVVAAGEYTGKLPCFKHLEYTDATPFFVGELSITPYRCDHSAFDSYMFLITDGVKKALYTGDFRSNGRADFDVLLGKLAKVDAVIIEGTLLSRENYGQNITEQQLEEIAVNVLSMHSGPAFLLTSAMNVDRIITGYHVAQRTGRLFLEDLYTAGVLKAAGRGYPAPGTKDVKAFLTIGGDKPHAMLQQYGRSKIGKETIARSHFLMCVRPSMKGYLEKLNSICSFCDGILFYGMWKGYQEQKDMKAFLEYMESLGVKIHVLHTSGHTDKMSIKRLINKIAPKKIIPVHTTNPEWFEQLGIEVVLDGNAVEI